MKDNRKLCAVLRRHGVHGGLRRLGWPEEQQAAALEAVDALPKAMRRVEWIDEQARRDPSDERQGQDRIKQLTRKIDALLKPASLAVRRRRLGNSRDDLLAYMKGADQPDTWRELVRMLEGDLRLAVRLRDFCDFPLADALEALQPAGFAERITWNLATKRFRGRFKVTPRRAQVLLRLRAALMALPSNARAGRPDSAAKPLIRAAVIAWKAVGRPMEFRFSSAHEQLSGEIADFLRDLLTLAELRMSDAALNQQLRTLRSV